MSRPSEVIVLVEDDRHRRFVRRYLERRGIVALRFEDLPSGRGCGEQWVRTRYAEAVRRFRWRSARATTALIVAIDVDPNGDVQRRVTQVADALRTAGMAARAPDERIVHFFPKLNIETWVVCLTEGQADEETDYKRYRGIDSLIPPAAVSLFDWTRPNAVPDHCVPSLRAGINEARRLP